MSSHVLVQVTRLFKHAAADVAEVSAFRGVRQHVCLEAAELRESTVADVTRKRFHVTVQHHVFAERSRVGKRLSAGAAHIRRSPECIRIWIARD